jgi:hypothetical protein
MRMIATGDSHDVEVIAESFEIPGTSERFAVHAAICEDDAQRGDWVAAHVETGFAIGFGETIDAAVAAGRAAWLSKSPEECAAALARVREFCSARRTRRTNGIDGEMCL